VAKPLIFHAVDNGDGDKKSPSQYNYVKGRTKPNLLGMRRSASYKLTPTPEQLASSFLGQALAAAAGLERGELSFRQLEELIGKRRYGDDLFAFFDSLEPYRRFGDFQGLETLPRPRPLHILIEPHILYGHFRAWLRKQGIDPDKCAAENTVRI